MASDRRESGDILSFMGEGEVVRRISVSVDGDRVVSRVTDCTAKAGPFESRWMESSQPLGKRRMN